MYVLYEGMVDEYVDGEHTKEIGPGKLIGECVTNQSKPRSSTIIAQTPIK